MNRRGFLGSLVAACVAPFVPTPKPQKLAFHKDAFLMVWPPRSDEWYQETYIKPAAEHLMREHDRLLMEHFAAGKTVKVRLPKRFQTMKDTV